MWKGLVCGARECQPHPEGPRKSVKGFFVVFFFKVTDRSFLFVFLKFHFIYGCVGSSFLCEVFL